VAVKIVKLCSLFGSGWVCAPKFMTRDQVAEAVDRECDPYIPALNGEEAVPWTVVERVHEDEGLESPGLCSEEDDHQHWFMIGGLSGLVLLARHPSGAEGIPQDTRIRTSFEEDLSDLRSFDFQELIRLMETHPQIESVTDVNAGIGRMEEEEDD